ncbi:MAG: glycine/sarcosine/betaine reductase component B subunit [Actinobacteria bacterium]|nr:glycine/sarcosine/betaine reductase component B subunit [Actinomycetota bacterium]
MRQPLRLDVHTVEIDQIRFGDHTGVDDGALVVDRDALAALILEDPRIAGVDVRIAQPGDDIRIIGCLDAVEPRCKVGDGSVFPGFLGGMETVGEGETLRLGGVAVLASSRYPQPFSGLLQAREAVVDMRGPTANLSPFGRTLNLVLAYTPNPDIDNEDYDDAIRRSNLRVAEHLATQALDAPRASTTTFDISEQDPDLPNVVYFYQLQGQGPMADTYLYGRVIHNLVPTVMHPNEALDGAIVCGVYVYGCYKNVTYLHQNNPIIWELQRRHGKELNFAGVVINRGHNYTQEDKERSSRWAAKLIEFLEADGAVFTAEGGGNSAIDMMLAVQYLEQAGVETAVVSSEAAGEDGYDFPLFYTVPEADAIVSVGSEDEVFDMPEVAEVIGGDTLLDGQPAAGPYRLKMYFQFCGTQQVGGNVLVGRVH